MPVTALSEKARFFPSRWVSIMFGMLLVSSMAAVPLVAETYKYVDEKGTVVFTDDPKTIPERYRARAKMVERTSTATPSGQVGQILTKAEEVSKGFVIGGLTPDQSRVLLLGFSGGVVMFAVMMLTGNSALRLLMRWLLVLLAIGTTASIYFSNDPVSQKASVRAKELERTQQQKAKDIERMDPAGEATR